MEENLEVSEKERIVKEALNKNDNNKKNTVKYLMKNNKLSVEEASLLCDRFLNTPHNSDNTSNTQETQTVTTNSNSTLSGIIGLIVVLVIIFAIFKGITGLYGAITRNPYIGTWTNAQHGTIVINKDKTGYIEDGVQKLEFEYDYKPESLGQLVIYVSGMPDVSCYLNTKEDAFELSR